MSAAEELAVAVRQAINDSETAAGSPDHLLDLQAAAAVEAMARSGWIKAAGWEYAVKSGDMTLEVGFNTESQAIAWSERHADGFDPVFTIERRPVGVWEPVDDTTRNLFP